MRISTLFLLTSTICLNAVAGFNAPTRQTVSQRNVGRSQLLSTAPFFFADETRVADAQSKEKTVVIAGASGYIGRAVVNESVNRGYNTIALVRSIEKIKSEEGQKR